MRLPAAVPRLPSPVATVRRRVRVDTRSLAAFRIALGLLIVVDVLLRLRNFERHYTDDGAVPQALARDAVGSDAFSLFFLTGDTRLIALLFALHAIVGVALCVGYATRIATLVSVLFVVSVDHHNPFVLSYGDTLFRLLLFWAIFLPLGERWSIDALQASAPRREVVASLGSAAILLQLVTMYVDNWFHKLPSDLWRSGMAGVYVLGIDELTFLLGDIVRTIPALVRAGALLWFALLATSPLLLVLQGRRRAILTFLFMGGHLGFALTMQLGAFPYVAIAGLVLFLQPRFWADAETVVAAVELADPLVRANRRLRMIGDRVAARIPGARLAVPGPNILHRGATALVLVWLIVTLLLIPLAGTANASLSLTDHPPAVDHPGTAALEAVGISQPAWRPFAGPDPRTTDRWYVFPAVTASGEVVDVFNDRPMSWERPEPLHRQYETYRDRSYMASVRRFPREAVAAAYGDYLCATWTDDHGVELAHINMWEVREEVTPETVDRPAARDRQYTRFYLHDCGGEERRSIAPPPDADPTGG